MEAKFFWSERMSQSSRKGIAYFHVVLSLGHMQLMEFLLLINFSDFPSISHLKMVLVSGQGISLLYSILRKVSLISSALQCAHTIGNRCVFVHGGSGGVGSSLLKILLSMREVKSECKNMQIVASCSRSDAERKLREMGVDVVVDRTEAGYMDKVHSTNNGKGPDVIFEMLANINLPKDLVHYLIDFDQ